MPRKSVSTNRCILKYQEYLNKLRLGTSHTFLSAFDKNFISLELLTSLTISLGRMTRESYLHSIFFLEPDSILPALSNQ
jgi:hypothetical protein